MGREIKFRGQRTDTKEWVYGYLSFIYVNGKDENGFIYTNKAKIYSQDEARNYDVITKSIGQYTGLKDKNGKEIYEGDIVKIVSYYCSDRREEDIRVVEYNENWACFSFGNSLDGLKTYKSINWKSFSIEVIGNKFQNPELLK